MTRKREIATAVFAVGAAVLVGAAKPAPAPAAFYPALAYKYGSQDIRLANADGSQAVLLVREPSGKSPLWLAIAPLGKREVAFTEHTQIAGGSTRSVRVASWTQQTDGGPLTVTLDPAPLFTLPNSDTEIRELDYSPDGTRLAVLVWGVGSKSEVRLFDVATRTQIGDAISLPQNAGVLSWRGWDNTLLLRGTDGTSSLNLETRQQTFLWGGNQTSPFDAFNGNSPEVMLPYKDYLVPGNTIQRWDGVSMSGGQPVLTQVVDGISVTMSCDNSKMMYIALGAKRTVYNLVLATGVQEEFSRDSSIQRPTYPNSCG